jgi:phage terminase small subunit
MMTSTKPSRKLALVEQRHATFAEAVAAGVPAKDAAITAGYSPTSAHNQGSRLMKDERIVSDIERRVSGTRQAF